RKQTEDALRESEEKFRKILEDMEDVYFEVDITGNITFVNHSSCKKSGYAEEELLGMSFKQISVPDGIGQVMKYFGEIFQTGQTGKPFIWNLKKKNGEEGFFEVVASLIRDKRGNPVGFKGIGRDITGRRKAEEALLRESNFSRAALDSLAALFYMFDDQGRFIRWNEYFTAVTGYSGKELARMTPLDVVVESERALLKQTMEKVLTTKHVSAELSILCKDGSVKPHFLTGNLIEFENKKCVIGMGIDITERIKTEAKLQQTLESLRKAVGTTIQVLVSAVEARDPYTAGHQSRVAHLACAIASEMGLAQDTIEGIRLAGSIHDIGKLSVPAEILTRPSKLTNIEFSMIKEHSQNGYEMLKHVESSWPLAEIVYQHHERMNGSGYPRNLKGDDILIEARILVVADVVEAMA
ncbi:MAG: PAS domain S-box protein, partial [Desulfobacterales bacterium]|nr:PAS domain S-box protein [Desulfobacterales bacterium]